MKVPLVLLHGWGVNAAIWNAIIPELESEFELHIIDLPGYGNSNATDQAMSLSEVTDIILREAPAQAVWVGWSLGGTIALHAALTHPERIRKLQLISTTPRFVAGSDWEFGVQKEAFDKLAASFQGDYAKALQSFLRLQLYKADRAEQRIARQMAKNLTSQLVAHYIPSVTVLQNGLAILAQTDLRGQLSRLTVDTQIIAGKTDPLVPIEASQFLSENLNSLHSLIEMETGHIPFLESPKGYIEALIRFSKTDP